MLDTLGAAYAADGRYEDAVRTTDRALALARNNPGFTRELLERRSLYIAGRAFTETQGTNPGANGAVR